MGNAKVEEYMSEIEEITVTTDTKISVLLKIMRDKQARAIIVTNANHHIQGIITGTDIIRELWRNSGDDLLESIVEPLMTPSPTGTRIGTLMIDAVDMMFKGNRHYIVVTNGFSPVGILTQMDVITWWIDENMNET